MKRIEICENGIHIAFETDGDDIVGLLNLSALPLNERILGERKGCGEFPLTELRISGRAYNGLRFADYRDSLDNQGRLITIVQRDSRLSLEAETVFRFFNGLPAVKIYTRLTNGGAPVDIAAFSGLCLTFAGCPEVYSVHPAAEEVCRECKPGDSGIAMGIMRSRETGGCLAWQADGAGGSFAQADGRYRLRLPEHTEGFTLRTGESVSCEACTIAAGTAAQGFEGVFDTFTRLRRLDPSRKKSLDLRDMPVIFDSETCPPEKLTSLAEAAGKAGCRYFMMNAGSLEAGADFSLSAELAESIKSSKMLPALRLDTGGSADTEAVRKAVSSLPKTNLLYLTGCTSPLPEEMRGVFPGNNNITFFDSLPADPGAPGYLWAAGGGYAFLAAPPEQILVRCDITENAAPGQAAAALIGGMLSRMCICGRLDKLGAEAAALVKESISVYKGLRADIRGGLPFTVPALPAVSEGFTARGVKCPCGTRAYLAVTRESTSAASYELSLPFFSDCEFDAAAVFPSSFSGELSPAPGTLRVTFGKRDTAVLIALDRRGFAP